MRPCVVYARVSSKEQEREGFSIPSQIRLLSEYAEKQGLTIVQLYTEAETAKQSGRPAFKQMVSLLKSKDGPKILLVEKTDRLTRNLEDQVTVYDLVKTHGVDIHYVRKGTVFNQDSPPEDELMQDFEAILAKHFIANLRRETKKGVLEKVRSGGWCWQPPHGYQMERGELVVDHGEAPFVRRAFELYAQGGQSLESLRKRLYEEGHFYTPTQSRIPKTQLHSLLTNRLYIGEVSYQGQVYPGRHEPLIDRGQWEAVQALMTGRAKAMTAQQFRYHGLITCGACGSLMSGEHKQGGRYTYYRCWKAANNQCSEKYVNEKSLDAAVKDLVSRLAFPVDYQERMREMLRRSDRNKQVTASDERNRILSEMARLDRKFEKAYQDRMDGLIEVDFWLKLKAKYEKDVATLKDALGRLGDAQLRYYDLALKYFELPEMLAETLSSGSDEKRGVLLRLLTAKFSVKGKKPALELASPFDRLVKQAGSEENYPQLNELRTILALHAVTIEALHRALAA